MLCCVRPVVCMVVDETKCLCHTMRKEWRNILKTLPHCNSYQHFNTFKRRSKNSLRATGLRRSGSEPEGERITYWFVGKRVGTTAWGTECLHGIRNAVCSYNDMGAFL